MPQLDPMLPLDTPKGEGFAFWRTDYSQEHDVLYSVIITATREIWDFPQPLVRGVKNISMGRLREVSAISDSFPRAFANEAKIPGWVIWVDSHCLKADFPPEFDPNGPALDQSGGPWTRLK